MSEKAKKPAARGLGKGINILIPGINEESAEGAGGVLKVGINEIEPNRSQPRKAFNDEGLRELADSIRAHGVIQPLIVRPSEDYYEIVAGERRWRAARIAGLTELPVIIRDYDELNSIEVALIENIQRENLSCVEEAFAYKRLQEEFSLTQDAIAEKVGKKRSTVANSMRLLNLSEAVLSMLDEGRISQGHAKALLSTEDASLQEETAKKIEEGGLSVRQAEELMKQLAKKTAKKQEASTLANPYESIYRNIESQMSSILGTKVKLSHGKTRSKIEIEFFSNDDLDRIYELFRKMEE